MGGIILSKIDINGVDDKECGRRKGNEKENSKNFSYQSVRVGRSQTTLANEISIFTKWGEKMGKWMV